MVLLTSTLMLMSTFPSAAGAPVVIDSFVGDITEAELTFREDPVNGSLSVEIPRGATVVDASLDLLGIPGYQATETQLDFVNGVVGKTVWAYHKGDAGIYPPKVDPYRSGWTHANKKEIMSLPANDGNYWQTSTTVQGMPPPAPPTEWPIQLFHFNPGVAAIDNILVSWTGHGWCQLNRTTPNHVEMWLYNHTGSKWEKVRTSTTANAKDVVINYTADTPTPYLSTNGSIDVAMVGSVSMTMGNMIANGELHSDYIEVKVTSDTTQVHPFDITLELGGENVTTLEGYLTDEVTIGAPEGLVRSLQDIIDGQTVMPGNLTIPLNISLPTPLNATIQVNDLRIEYEPVVNLAPHWEGPASVDLVEDSPWTVVMDLDTAFTDDHNQGELSYQVMTVSDPVNLSVQLGEGPGGNTTLEGQGANDFFGQVQLMVRATDLFDAFVDSELVTVNVLQRADSPILDVPAPMTVDEGEAISYTFTLTDVDLPDDSHTFSDATDLFDVDEDTGYFTWTPGTTDVGSHNIRVTVTDRFGLTDTIQFTITVLDVNQAPSITSALTVDAVQGEQVVYTIRAEDPDVPFGDSLTFSAFADGLEVNVNDRTGYLTFTPGNDQVPNFEITLRVEDRAFARDEATLVVTVENRNDAPTLQPLGPLQFNQGDMVSIRLTFDDPDLDLDLQEPEVLSIETQGTIEMAADQNGLIEFVPDQSMVGDHTVSYTVSDREGAKVTIVVEWTILDINDPPVITTELGSPVEATEDEPFVLDLDAEDPEKDTIEWSDDTDMFDIDMSTGRISFTPTQADVGTHTILVTVSDGDLFRTTSFTLYVANVNDDPVITGVTPATGTRTKQGKVAFTAAATDEDGDDLTFTWMEGDEVLTTGMAPPPVKLGTGKHTITLVVDDGTTQVTQDIVVTVEGSDESPGFGIALLIAVVLVALVVTSKGRTRP
ncbi:MAG: tandem-95 repeat protein [Thermoplasmata archaeon]|nr:MAG: tandem-95 repeat protein [Thermoplasmata archaeon]